MRLFLSGVERTLHRQKPEKDKQIVNVVPPGKYSADVHALVSDGISVGLVLETHFCESRSQGFQVSSRSRRLQASVAAFCLETLNISKKGLSKTSISFLLLYLYLQVRNNENSSEKCQKLEKFILQMMMTFLKNFGKIYKFWSLESRSRISILGLGIFNKVSVSKF